MASSAAAGGDGGGILHGRFATLADGLMVLNRDMLKGCSLLAVDLEIGKNV